MSLKSWMKQATEHIHWTFEKLHNDPNTTNGIKIVWNTRLRVTAGKAYLRPMQIALNPHLWARMSDTDRRHTAIHEACHIVAYLQCGHSDKHGKVWQGLMRQCGLEPRRCHNYDISGLKRSRYKRYPVQCQCRTHYVTMILLNRIRRRGGFCNTCGQAVKEVV